ncbi:ubiquinone biosynthesis accessory factor UbiJ [Shewanella gaetbuli]|uniref:Ubiquinone biosynthesis accessory factor UbiJ n=1 Tax=Shewanella gaetbuli TaxID=220752 RepID=A0A9X2CKZ7_9GAMM|nr:SCP2 sterol-binding domain-containing protein [Shewanella gaetbuli]MCL1142144.1 SCP2 sterol-binding domain-containing protein [Shewanella gaetbuli]
MTVNHFALLTCAAIETGLTKLPASAQQEYARLKNLHGKVFCIELSQLSWPIYLIFAKQIQVMSRFEGDTHVTVKADASTLYQLKEGANLTELIKQDKLSIEGDLQLLQTFSHFMQHIEFDLEEPLSRYIGDGLTHKVVSTSQLLGQELSTVFNKTLSHLSQLTTEEYRLAPHKIEYIHFRDNLEQLVTQTDQIEQRIAQLRDTLTS